jgi:hypothetical protein
LVGIFSNTGFPSSTATIRRNYRSLGPTTTGFDKWQSRRLPVDLRSQGRKRVRFGGYEPADNAVSWDNPADPNPDRTGETTGPQLFTLEQEELQHRESNALHNNAYAGNLEFGKSRQSLLDSSRRSRSPTRTVRLTRKKLSKMMHNPSGLSWSLTRVEALLSTIMMEKT